MDQAGIEIIPPFRIKEGDLYAYVKGRDISRCGTYRLKVDFRLYGKHYRRNPKAFEYVDGPEYEGRCCPSQVDTCDTVESAIEYGYIPGNYPFFNLNRTGASPEVSYIRLFIFKLPSIGEITPLSFELMLTGKKKLSSGQEEKAVWTTYNASGILHRIAQDEYIINITCTAVIPSGEKERYGRVFISKELGGEALEFWAGIDGDLGGMCRLTAPFGFVITNDRQTKEQPFVFLEIEPDTTNCLSFNLNRTGAGPRVSYIRLFSFKLPVIGDITSLSFELMLTGKKKLPGAGEKAVWTTYNASGILHRIAEDEYKINIRCQAAIPAGETERYGRVFISKEPGSDNLEFWAGIDGDLGGTCRLTTPCEFMMANDVQTRNEPFFFMEIEPEGSLA
jgi:hypothetical protein